MKFPAPDQWPHWSLWTRPEATGGRWAFQMAGTHAECVAAIAGHGLEFSIRRAEK